MKTSNKKILMLALVPVAVLFLSGCGKQEAKSVPAPIVAPKVQTTPQSISSTDPLPPLPTDNKQAIDSEVQGIDQELQQVDDSLSTDAVDTELGL